MEIFSTGYTATTFLGSAATAAQTFFADLGPVVAVVAGIVLALYVIPWVIGLFSRRKRTA